MIVTVHQLLAPLVAATGFVLLAIVIVGGVRRRSVRFAADRAILVALGLVLLSIASGLVVLLTGGRPSDPLHLLYAVVALLLLPVARFWGRFERHRGIVLGLGGVVLAALVLRLFQTG